MRPKQTTADDTDITDVVEAFVPNVCVGADPLGTANTTAHENREITADAERVCRPQISQISADSDS